MSTASTETRPIGSPPPGNADSARRSCQAGVRKGGCYDSRGSHPSMNPPRDQGLTELLRRWSAGDRAAAERAMALVYDDLRAIARRFFRRERASHTLEAT